MTKDEYLKLTAFLEAREFCGEKDDERYQEALEKWVTFVYEYIYNGEHKDWPVIVHLTKKMRNNPYPFGPLS